jgi:hypothetical protein
MCPSGLTRPVLILGGCLTVQGHVRLDKIIVDALAFRERSLHRFPSPLNLHLSLTVPFNLSMRLLLACGLPTPILATSSGMLSLSQ